MARTWFLTLLLFGISMALAADQPPIPPMPEKGKVPPLAEKGKEETPPIKVVKLIPTQGVASKPIWRYRLVPDPMDLTATNAVPLLMRVALIERELGPKQTKEQLNLLTPNLPFEELPRKELLAFLESYRTALSLVEDATRCKHCEWSFPPLKFPNSINFPLPELQPLRKVAVVLSLRCRLELQEGKLNEALQTIRTGLTLGHQVGTGEVPLIQSLVGMAITQQFLLRLEEYIQQPGSGNLYWALTQLPTPLFDFRQSSRIELNALIRSMPQLRDVAIGPMSVEQVNRLFNDIAIAGDFHYSAWEIQWARFALCLKLYPAARKALLEQGFTTDQVKAMPSLQVVLMSMAIQYEETTENLLKWLGLPSWQALPGLKKAHHTATENFVRNSNLFILLLPPVAKWYEHEVRIEWHMAGLRTGEALRLYAVAHKGQPPAKLSDITEVPLPINPITGRDFSDAYTVKDGVGVLELVSPQPGTASMSRRFEIAPPKP